MDHSSSDPEETTVTTLQLSQPTTADPRAWTASTIDPSDAWYYPLPAACRSLIEATLRDLERQPRPLTEVRLSGEDRAAMAESLCPVLADLERGRGFAIVQGPDPAETSDLAANVAYWLVGQGLGEPFEQNVQGTLLYDVRDTGQNVAAGARFSVTNAESSFHTDNSFGETVLDYVGLLCLRTARSGGINQLVSGFPALDRLRAEEPSAVTLLEQRFHVDRRGGVLPGQSPTAQIPVIEERDEGLLYRYLRYWIEVGHQKAGEPLTSEQVRALDTFDAVLARPALRVEFALRPGEMLFINNRWLLHNRTAFEDHPEPERRRHLVRLWLRSYSSQ
jgi:alpha-ketoglutarate-dependent taurine dioxygenase